MTLEKDLLATTDAMVWAVQWCDTARDIAMRDGPMSIVDEGWMVGWFANAMAAQRNADHAEENKAAVQRAIADTGNWVGHERKVELPASAVDAVAQLLVYWNWDGATEEERDRPRADARKLIMVALPHLVDVINHGA